MAKEAAAKSEESTKSSGPSFKAEKIGRADVNGFWVAKPGAEVEGRAVDRFQIENDDGKLRDIVVVELTKPAECVMDKKEITLQPGQFAGVGIGEGNKDLLLGVAKKALVYCRAIEKKDIGKGRKMWRYELFIEKGMKAPPPPLATSATAKHGDDDAPF